MIFYSLDNQLNADVVNSVVNAPFAKSLTIFSLFSNEFSEVFIR